MLTPLSSICGERTLELVVVGNQFKPQMLTNLPGPILHLAPHLTTSLPFIILFKPMKSWLEFWPP